jgi:hypothetical protein
MSYKNLGGGRKVRDPIMVKRLLEWFKKTHDIEGIKINVRQFKKKALELSSFDDFRASKGWFEKFKKRYKINL